MVGHMATSVFTFRRFADGSQCDVSERTFITEKDTFCSAALLRLLEMSSRRATSAPRPSPMARSRKIPFRLCACTAEDLALSARQLLAHHLLLR